MKLTREQYADALSRGFTPHQHKLSGFAEACYDMNSYDDIKECKTSPVDRVDCKTWQIDKDAWREAQVEAIETAMADHSDQLS